MEESTSTLEAISKYTIVGESLLLPAFQVVQQFKSLPYFLMFPTFISALHYWTNFSHLIGRSSMLWMPLTLSRMRHSKRVDHLPTLSSMHVKTGPFICRVLQILGMTHFTIYFGFSGIITSFPGSNGSGVRRVCSLASMCYLKGRNLQRCAILKQSSSYCQAIMIMRAWF